MNKYFVVILGLVLAVLADGDAHKLVSKGKSKDSIIPPGFAGDWSMPCSAVQNSFLTAFTTISPGFWSRTYYVWDDANCTVLGAVAFGSGSDLKFRPAGLGKRQPGKGPDAWNIDWIYTTRTVTPVRANFVTIYNGICPGWTINVARDVLLGLQCPALTIYDNCTIFYDIGEVIGHGDILELGLEHGDKNYCTPQNRSSTFSPFTHNRVESDNSGKFPSKSVGAKKANLHFQHEAAAKVVAPQETESSWSTRTIGFVAGGALAAVVVVVAVAKRTSKRSGYSQFTA